MKLVDPMDFSINPILANLQGNIIKGHGRDHTTHIFIQFKPNKIIAAKKWLKSFADEHVTSCKKQLKERELYNRNKTGGGTFGTVYLTAAGYKYLGFTNVNTKFSDAAFKAGMKARKAITNDPDKNDWEEGFKNDIHAMVLLADANTIRMASIVKDILPALIKIAAISTIEYGNAIRNANGDGLEHFGYVDGVSQPLFLKDEVDAYHAFHNTAGNGVNFDPAADTDLVLIPDPYAAKADAANAFGSYFVFRKLEQQVRAFKKAEEDLGMGELGGASLVGRFEDGSPVILDDEDGIIGSGSLNNFNYNADPSGGRCPHFAHIRKSNPRSSAADKTHTMARRGIPFGLRNVDTVIDPAHEQMPESGVGLLFMSYQKSIENQFEFIQQTWVNDPGFPTGKNTAVDPIIGQLPVDDHKRSYIFAKEYGGTVLNPKPGKFHQFVTMKGGEYFFAPSISFLSGLV